MNKTLIVVIISFLGFGSRVCHPKKQRTFQFDTSSILNARPITTVANNHLTTWTKGIDGGGKGDGYLTKSAALFNKQDTAHALPDDGLFKETHLHPEIQLHYSNRDSTHNQACSMAGEGAISFSVGTARYKHLYFALTSAEGATSLKIALVYSDGVEVRDIVVPDYYQDIPETDTNFCYLAHNLAKWGPANQMTEKDHHNIDLLWLSANPQRKLTGIRISKGKAGYLVFWAAAGTM